MPLGRKVGFNPSNIVLEGDPAAPPQKGRRAPPPIFGPCLLWPNGWMDQEVTGMEVSLGPVHIVLDMDPAPHKKGGTAPNFRPMSVVATSIHNIYLNSLHMNLSVTVIGGVN